MTDPSALTLTEVAAAVRERKLSSVEVTRSLLPRIDSWQPHLNGFVRAEAEEALAAAPAADAAVAGGVARGPLHGVPLAHKDMYYTGGSIRLPAHFCGVTGFKPTYGRVSRANSMPLSFALDTIGPLALSAEDYALIDSVIVGADPLDPTTSGSPTWNIAATQRAPKDMTVGVPRKFYVDDLESDVAAPLDDALATFRELGARVVEVDLLHQTAIGAAALIVLAAEATSTHAPWLRERAGDYGAQVRNRLQNGLAYSAVEYLEALRWRGPGLAAYFAATNNIDIVIAPAARAAAPTIEETDVGGGFGAEAAIQTLTRFTRPINYLRLPALGVPAGQSRSGMPIGLQLVGRPFDDERVIARGRAFHIATNHHRHVPVLP